MSNTEIEKMLTSLKVKVDVQNYQELIELLKKFSLPELIALLNASSINATWEYKSLRIHVSETMDTVTKGMTDKMGKEGYELVAIVPNVFPEPGKSYEAFFKKRIR